MKKWIIIILLVIAVSFALLVILKPVNQSKNKLERQISAQEQEILDSKTFTKENLLEYDGKDGRKAYIAVNGIVYDVTDIKQWKNGEHHGMKAGNDLTSAFLKSHHGSSALSKLKIIGKYKE